MKALAPKHKGGEMEEFRDAVDEQLRLERRVSLAKGDETALVIEWKPQWDVGAPMPHVLSSQGRAFLIYRLSEPDSAWDGAYVNVVDPAANASEPLAIVEFQRCYAHRFGGPNDEVITGHPLHGKGLQAYRAHEVANSRWLAADKASTVFTRGIGSRVGPSGSTTYSCFTMTASSVSQKDTRFG